jgi:GAF domain-containing protein
VTLAANTRVLDLLRELAHSLVEPLDADACVISRVLGDALLVVTQASRDGRTLPRGHGYLVSEHPEAQRVLRRGEPGVVCLGEPDADRAELKVLEDLGFASLLTLPLELYGETWGLVELYRGKPRPFGPVEIRAAATRLRELAPAYQ